MKKKTLLILCCICVFGLTGCEKAISLTDEEEKVIAEYLAGALLKRDKSYDQALIEPTPTLTPTPVPTQAVAATPVPGNDQTQQFASGNSSDGNQQANTDFTHVIGIDGVTVEYNGCEVLDSYGSGDSYRLDASSGKKLFVVEFTVKNSKDKAVKLSLGDLNINYQLNLDTNKIIRPLLTYLDNDLRYLDVTIEANNKFDAVIVFSIDKDAEYQNANVVISKDDKTAIVKVK